MQKSPDILGSRTLSKKKKKKIKAVLSTDSDTVNCGGDPEQSDLQCVQSLC